MKSNQNFPPLGEFMNLANSFHFNEKEIAFQKKKALQFGYASWEDYLKTFYQLITSQFNIDAIVKDLSTSTDETIFLSGSFQLSLEKNQNTEKIKMSAPILRKVNALPAKEYKRVKAFQNQLVNLFKFKILENFKDDPRILQLVQHFESEVELQNQAIKSQPSTTKNKSTSLIDSFLFPQTNDFIKKNRINPFYFPSKYQFLPTLYDALLELKYIEANNDFIKSFDAKNLHPSTHGTVWLADTSKLFYLLYRLNNKKEYFEGMSIDKIAQQLFTFKTIKSSNSMRTTFSKCLPNFEDSVYLNKKMKDLKTLLDSM